MSGLLYLRVLEQPTRHEETTDLRTGKSNRRYTNFFWEDNPNDAGRKRRIMADGRLLSLMMRLYIHLEGTETNKELEFWQKLI